MKYSVITGAEVSSSFTILPRCTLAHILKQSRSNAVVNQSRAVCALVIVSSVVKVFEEMVKKVSAGARS